MSSTSKRKESILKGTAQWYPSSPSSDRKRDKKREYLEKLSNKIGSKIPSPHRSRRTKEILRESTSKNEGPVMLSDKINEHFDNSLFRNEHYIALSNYYTPHEPVDCQSIYNMLDLYDKHSDNVTKNIDLTRNDCSKEREEEYCSSMEEINDETIGVLVKEPKGNDALFSFRKKPSFPKMIIPIANKFDQNNFDFESVDELTDYNTREFNSSGNIDQNLSCSKQIIIKFEQSKICNELSGSEIKINDIKCHEIASSLSPDKDFNDELISKTNLCQPSLPSPNFMSCMEKKMHDYKNFGSAKAIENYSQKDPFSMIHENSKDGSVILNHTFQNGNNLARTDSQISNTNWIYKTSSKYKSAVVDYDVSSSAKNSPRRADINMIINDPIPEKSNENSSSNEQIAKLQKVKQANEQELVSVMKIGEKENIQDDILESIRSLHSKLDSIQSVLSSNNHQKEEDKSEEQPINFQRDSSEFQIKNNQMKEALKSDTESELDKPVAYPRDQLICPQISDALRLDVDISNSFQLVERELTPKLPTEFLNFDAIKSSSSRNSETSVEMAAIFPSYSNNDRLQTEVTSNNPPKRIISISPKRKSIKRRKSGSRIYDKQMKWLREKNERNEIMRREQYKSIRSKTRSRSVKSSRPSSPKSQRRLSTSICKTEKSTRQVKTKRDKTFCDFLIRNEIWQENKKKHIEETTNKLRSAEKLKMTKDKPKRRSRSARKRNKQSKESNGFKTTRTGQ
ncbi:unnamed protein product [Moneuplotes crassus]|uniref:Uncharacterized protein n=1 Tax=Euplotes crassus TaxID=5936 RepID=A0AAD1Y827_EUPCR|nr:unnamed protein product [Moneuplotes crassus]